MGIREAPIEIITLIMECLDLDDVFNLSLTCHQFGQIIRSQGLSRIALKKAQYSLEFAEAEATGDYARGLRRLVKRRCAVRSARPFHVAIMAVANEFIYTNGALCYTICHEGHEYLRISFLSGCASTELEVSTRSLLVTALPSTRKLAKYKFRPLHYAQNIMSGVYTFLKDGAPVSWLVVWHVQSKRLLSAHQLASTKGLFVRNDADHLYYGTRSGHGRDGSWRWLIRGLDLHTRSWSDKVVLHDLRGTSIGRTVCFEIIDGYFYGLSVQALAVADDNKSNSFYHAFRFRLGQHTSMTILPKSATWRRQATEGSIDNRWTQLSLSKDETSGQIYVYESRKEWLSTDSQSQRTCYKKALTFPDAEEAVTFCSPPDSEDWNSELYWELRQAENVHTGDNGSKGTIFTYNNSPIRAYNVSCNSFVDLVNDPDPNLTGSDPDTSFLRLRVRPRNNGSLLEPTQRGKSLLNGSSTSSGMLSSAGDDEGVTYWPPRKGQDSTDSRAQLLKKIMNPQSSADGIDWAADERLLIYSPKSANKGQHRGVVLISFDPGLHLYGLPKFHGGHAADLHQCASSPNASCGEAGHANCEACSVGATADVEFAHDAGLQAESILQETKYDTTSGSVVRLDPELAAIVRQSRAYYLAIQGCDGAPYGFDLTL
ncbi:hypothetical protein HJFPF1_01929 [Paramyrothecium foliicola]|nr:hypothetical protein HJFPF1_01929 [Paramyrothecium foliicola]